MLRAESREQAECSAADEVTEYMRQPNRPHQLCPLEWWKLNQQLYPHVAEIAHRYLSAPSTSVPSEQLFSSAGDLYSDSRNRLSAKVTVDVAAHKAQSQVCR